MANKHGSQKQFRFVVVAGTLKGRVIVTPDLGVTRPPLSRLRRAIFDFLAPRLNGVAYLDLFSGSGSYLFEAVSRGASRAVGVEREKLLAEVINSEASRLGVSEHLACRCGDVFEILPRMALRNERFEVVMIAPPQYQGLIDKTLSTMCQHRVTADNALIVCQHDTSEIHINWAGFPVQQTRAYGNTTFTVLRAG